jgi:hypothetical protein
MTFRCKSDIVDNPQVQDLRRTGGGSYSVDNPQMQCGTHPLDNPQVQDPPSGQPSGAGPTPFGQPPGAGPTHLDNPQVQDPTIWTTPRCRTHHLDNPQVQQDSPFGQPPGARPALWRTLRSKAYIVGNPQGEDHRTPDNPQVPFPAACSGSPSGVDQRSDPPSGPKRGWVGQPSGSCNSDPTLRLGPILLKNPKSHLLDHPQVQPIRLEVPDNPQVSQELLLRVAQNQGKVDGNPSEFDSVANPQVLMFPLT